MLERRPGRRRELQQEGVMSFQIQKAERVKLLLRGAFIAPSGGGKTKSALRMASGFVGPKGRIGLIDTEARRSLIYATEHNFDVLHLDPPFRPERYIEAIEAFESAGYGPDDIILVDSASHEWAGKGGLLEDLDSIPGENSYTKWKHLTPRHNKFIEKLNRCNTNLLITLRGKDEYVLEDNSKGKKAPKKVGIGAIQRDGLEYEFQFTLLIDQQSHVATASKDNTHLFEDRWDIITEEHGKALREWCETGASVPDEKVEDALILITEARNREELTAILESCPNNRDRLIPACKDRQADLIIAAISTEETASQANMTIHNLMDQIDRLNGQWRTRIMKAAKKHVDALAQAEKAARQELSDAAKESGVAA